jgi:hypothetical protein
MSEPITGGCACGRVRYAIDAEPTLMLECRCRDCQRESGTGHASHLSFPRAAASVQGDATHWDAVGELGTTKRRAFCPTCGAPVYMTFPEMPDVFVVRAGSLDDPSRYAPQVILWMASAHPWDPVIPGLPTFDRMPPR